MSGENSGVEDFESSLECARNLLALKSTPEEQAKNNSSIRSSGATLETAPSNLNAPPNHPGLNSGSQSETTTVVDHGARGEKAEQQPSCSIHQQLLRDCDDLKKQYSKQNLDISQLQNQVREMNQIVQLVIGERSYLDSMIKLLQRRVHHLEISQGYVQDLHKASPLNIH